MVKYPQTETKARKKMLKGKRLSILGDSVSTYKGVSDDKTANSTLIYNPCFYGRRMPEEKTYWRIVMDTLGMTLCVNNSYSGGNLCGRDNAYSGFCRADNLSRDDGASPDFIIVFMGLNDLGRGVAASVFSADYNATLQKIKKKYPEAEVLCINLPDRDVILKERAEIFNREIENAVRNAGEGFFIADLFGSRLNNDTYYINTLDGLHPDEDGMRIIAEVVLEAIEKHKND